MPVGPTREKSGRTSGVLTAPPSSAGTAGSLTLRMESRDTEDAEICDGLTVPQRKSSNTDFHCMIPYN